MSEEELDELGALCLKDEDLCNPLWVVRGEVPHTGCNDGCNELFV